MSATQRQRIMADSGSSYRIGLACLLLALRITNAFAVKTFFQPDEYFQSLEPAWQAAFGSASGAWITWEWREGLRSSLHPLLFAGAYRAANSLGLALDLSLTARSELLLACPKILQAVFAATMDLFTHRLACQTYGTGSKAAQAALWLTILSPWQAFCSVRTLSNSIETSLTVVALDLWPWGWWTARPGAGRSGGPSRKKTSNPTDPTQEETTNLHLSLATAGLACILRPTNTIIWIAISLTLLVRHGDPSKLIKLAQAAALSGGAILAVSVSADRIFYQTWVLPPLRFLQFNLVQSLAVFYGKNRPDYYLTEGIPLLLTTALPFGVIGMWQALRVPANAPSDGVAKEDKIRFTLAVAVVASVGTLSLISHKEVRFIYPLLPMLHVLAAKPIADFFGLRSWPRRRNFTRRVLLSFLLFTNLVIVGYTLFVHQRGVIDVLHFLRKRHEASVATSFKLDDQHAAPHITTVGFLMPCHSTPWRSHLVHPKIHAWALTCEPPLNLTMAEREIYLDEADVFYDNPVAWIDQNMGADTPGGRPWPDFLVFFRQMQDTVSSALEGRDLAWYEGEWRGFNTHWHDDSRRQGDIVVYERKPHNPVD